MCRPDFSAMIVLTRQDGVYGATATLVDTGESIPGPEDHVTAEGCLGALLSRVFARIDAAQQASSTPAGGSR